MASGEMFPDDNLVPMSPRNQCFARITRLQIFPFYLRSERATDETSNSIGEILWKHFKKLIRLKKHIAISLVRFLTFHLNYKS